MPLRDCAGSCVLFIVFCAAAELYAIRSTKVAITYLVLLIIQHPVARPAASNSGMRFVTTVLVTQYEGDLTLFDPEIAGTMNP